MGSSMMIIPLDDKGEWLLDDYIEKNSSLIFDGPPDYDKYGETGSKAYFVEEFMEQINEKRLNGVVPNNFIQKDLIVRLEFADGSKVVFDRYYTELEQFLLKNYNQQAMNICMREVASATSFRKKIFCLIKIIIG